MRRLLGWIALRGVLVLGALVLGPFVGWAPPSVAAGVAGDASGGGGSAGRGAGDFFESRVRPVLAENCHSCHGPKRQRAGLRLDSRTAALKGSDSGEVLVPGEPEKSRLIQAVRHQGKVKMPPRGKLPDEAIEALETWVRMGAPWPEAAGAAAPGAEPGAEATWRTHWAFEPVRKPPLPAVKDEGWVRNDIDRFVLSRLEERGLAPAPPASRRALVRRISYDLTGLPPTAGETARFEGDETPGALAEAVERCLSSPRYGERWARHWLDLARYSDTKGYVFEEERRFPYSYTYRDWCIRAFNEDLPYDRFILEQLAADQLEPADQSKPADRGSLAAMGFLTLGRRFLNNASDIIDDRIDVVTRGFLALTVTCARCHDHKYDPVPTHDYYSLYGVFASSQEPRELPLIAEPAQTDAYRAFEKGLRDLQAEADRFLGEKHEEIVRSARDRVGEYLAAALRPPAPEERAERLQLTAGALHPRIVRRWRESLEETARGHHPVFAAWHALVALPEGELAARGPAVVDALASRLDPEARVNGRVVRALVEKPPATFQELAERYGEVLLGAEKRWREVLEAHQKEGAEAGAPPSRLDDNEEEELRQVLHGPKSAPSIPLAEGERFFNRAQRDGLRKLRRKVEEYQATAPGAPPRAMVLVDVPEPRNARVFLRGNPQNPGEEVPRQFLGFLSGEERRPFSKGSGRLELARSIASPANPLTARVMVNRIWLHLFGEGLVRTPGDFGLRSEPPVHRELLDHLAARFVEGGWSVKSLVRYILSSATYAQSAEAPPELLTLDPENTLLARASRRRLDWEALRDSLVFVTGGMDFTVGGPSVDLFGAPFSRRRSLYGSIDRQNLPGVLRAFDFASPDTLSPQRHVTTVPQQALFLMNSAFVEELARAVLRRPELAAERSAAARLRHLHRIVLGREPEAAELARAQLYLERQGGDPAGGEPAPAVAAAGPAGGQSGVAAAGAPAGAAAEAKARGSDQAPREKGTGDQAAGEKAGADAKAAGEPKAAGEAKAAAGKQADGAARSPPPLPPPPGPWETYVQALLLSNEFAFVD